MNYCIDYCKAIENVSG